MKHLKEVILGLMKPTSFTIFTSLLKKQKDQNGNLTAMYPDLPQSVRNYMKAVVDLVGVMYMDKQGQRKLGFVSPKGIAEVKDRSGKLTETEEPNISLILQKIFKGGGKDA